MACKSQRLCKDLTDEDRTKLIGFVRRDALRSRYCFSADDIAAEAALWLCEHQETEVPHSNELMIWSARRLFGETRNGDQYRIREPDRQINPEWIGFVPDPEPMLIEALDLMTVLNRTKDYQSWLFVQHEIHGRTETEIAMELKLSVRTVNTHLSVVRSLVRNGLIDMGYEFPHHSAGVVKPSRRKTDEVLLV